MVLFNTPIDSQTLVILTIAYFVCASVSTFDTRIIQAKKNGYLAEDDAHVPAWTGLLAILMWCLWLVIFLLNWWYALLLFAIKFILKVFPVLENVGAFLLIPIVGIKTASKVNIVAQTQKEASRQLKLMFKKRGKEETFKWDIPISLLSGSNIAEQNPRFVSLREALESEEYKRATEPLAFPVGRDKSGKFVIADMHKLAHIMAGGQTGSGKSSFVEGTLVLSLIYRNSPDDLKLLLIDPKQVQFMQYNGIPHLLRPVIVDPDETKDAVQWLLGEMEERFETLAKNRGIMNIEEFNTSGKGHMPYILLVIDEVSDLMMVDGKFYEKAFISLLQKARAVGIHLYIGTSRPSPDVLPGLLRANFPTKIAFATASSLDSTRIINFSGAEELSGLGDLLIDMQGESQLIHLQAPYASEEEQDAVIQFILKHT